MAAIFHVVVRVNFTTIYVHIHGLYRQFTEISFTFSSVAI